jgi:hypothetical protein
LVQEGVVVGEGEGLEIGREGTEAGEGGGGEGGEAAGGGEAGEGILDAEEQAMLGILQIRSEKIDEAAGIPHRSNKTGGEGVLLELGHASEQDNGHFPLIGHFRQSIQLPLDLGTGRIIGGGKEQIGIVNQDQTDRRVLMEQLVESIEVI